MRSVTEYLSLVRSVTSPEIDETLRDLERRRDELAAVADADEARAREALAHLAKKRLLASSTLKSPNREDRLAWDEANYWLNERIAAEMPRSAWSIADVAVLNAILLGAPRLRPGALDTPSRPRATPIYAGPDAYLEPELVEPELATLEAYVRTARRHPVLVAAAVYIGVVTIHPFENANGRTARLAADAVLLTEGFLPLCFLSPIAAHVAQMLSGVDRDPIRSVRLVLDAVRESYTTVLGRLNPR